MKAEFTDSNNDSVEWTNERGEVWYTKLSGDGQIPDQLKEWVAKGNTISPYVEPPKPFTPLPRAAFLFMAKKLGLDDTAVRGLIARMPATTQEEIDAKDLALLVYENQQTFERDNALLKTLVAVSGLTDKQVNAAWRIGENIKW